VQQAIIESMKSITHYAETISVVKACYQIQEDLKEVYGMQFDKQAHIYLFGNATQSIFCVMCALKQIVRRPSALVINPSYYSIKKSAKLFNIPVNEMWRKSRENFILILI
jgi:aspartate/methionine/tyrosine aminotransferase